MTPTPLETMAALTPQDRKAVLVIIRMAQQQSLLQTDKPQNKILNIFRRLLKCLRHDFTRHI